MFLKLISKISQIRDSCMMNELSVWMTQVITARVTVFAKTREPLTNVRRSDTRLVCATRAGATQVQARLKSKRLTVRILPVPHMVYQSPRFRRIVTRLTSCSGPASRSQPRCVKHTLVWNPTQVLPRRGGTANHQACVAPALVAQTSLVPISVWQSSGVLASWQKQ